MRLQLALNVDDLEAAIDYYGRLFGAAVNKREPGYANFVVTSPPLKLVLFEAPGAERLNHLGVEVFDTEAVESAARHLESQGLLADVEQGEVCCYARQNKAISYDPQGLMWEYYEVLADSKTFFAEDQALTQRPAVGSGTLDDAAAIVGSDATSGPSGCCGS